MNFDSSVLQVAVEDIIPNRFQPRLVFEDNSLQELSNSIKEHGIIQPLVLRKVGEKYEIIAGERRYKAATMAGLATVPAVISQADDRTSAEAAIVENVQRKDLTAIEEAKSYKALLDQGYMSQEQLARKMGLSQSAISNKLRLLTLPEEIQKAVMDNKISERHARSLLKIKDNEEKLTLMNRIIKERLTVRQLDDYIKKAHPTGIQNVDIEEVRETAEDIKGTPVTEESQNTPDDKVIKDAISLGEREQNRLFNSLENVAANMDTHEPVNPFDGFLNKDSAFSHTTSVDTKVNKAEKIPNQEDISISPIPGKVLGNINTEKQDDTTTSEEEKNAMNLFLSQLSNEPQDIFPSSSKPHIDLMNEEVEQEDMPNFANNTISEEESHPINNFANLFKNISKPETNLEKEEISMTNDEETASVEPTDLIVDSKKDAPTQEKFEVAVQTPPVSEDIEMLDTLDFEPPKKEKDYSKVLDRIKSLLQKLEEEIPITYTQDENDQEITINIKIKKD